MNNENDSTLTVPWTSRDVWMGIMFEILLFGLAIILSLLMVRRFGRIDPGILISITEILLLVPVWFLAVGKYKAKKEVLGFREIPGGTIGLGCGLIILSFMFNALYGGILGYFKLSIQRETLVKAIQSSSLSLILIGGAIIGPFVEEIFFRGFVFAGLRRPYGFKKAAIISSAIFAVMHIQWTIFLPIFILGFIFAYLYEKSHSIWPAIIMHTIVNTFAIGSIYFLKGIKW